MSAKRVRSRLSMTLSAAHLRAIGKVAAAWSTLELHLLIAISQEAGTDLEKTVILVGPQNVSGWCDILKKLSRDSSDYEMVIRRPGDPDRPKKRTELDKVCSAIIALSGQRNEVVHAIWQAPEQVFALGDLLRPTSSTAVEAITIPKRGKVFVKSSFLTARNMLDIARKIEAAEISLAAWTRRRKEALLSVQVLQALRDYPSPLTSQTLPQIQPAPSRP